MKINFDSDYIHKNEILRKIYEDAVNKFFDKAAEQIVFYELADYVARKLKQRRQFIYDHAIPIVKEVCQKIGEDFNGNIEHCAPGAQNYRDVYYLIYES